MSDFMMSLAIVVCAVMVVLMQNSHENRMAEAKELSVICNDARIYMCAVGGFGSKDVCEDVVNHFKECKPGITNKKD